MPKPDPTEIERELGLEKKPPAPSADRIDQPPVAKAARHRARRASKG